MICKSRNAAPDGFRSPDSHFRPVTLGTLKIRAIRGRLNFRCLRSLTIGQE